MERQRPAAPEHSRTWLTAGAVGLVLLLLGYLLDEGEWFFLAGAAAVLMGAAGAVGELVLQRRRG